MFKNSHLGADDRIASRSSEASSSSNLTDSKLGSRPSLSRESLLSAATTKTEKSYGYAAQERSEKSLKCSRSPMHSRAQRFFMTAQMRELPETEVDTTNDRSSTLHHRLRSPQLFGRREIPLENQKYKWFSNLICPSTNTSTNKSCIRTFGTGHTSKSGVVPSFCEWCEHSFRRSQKDRIPPYQHVIDASKAKSIQLKPESGSECNASTYCLSDMLKSTKYRPLSAASICSTNSTSSSSSSGSGVEHLSCKHSTSYLASVESLADQSEPELTELNVHAAVVTTVFERACLEIVDSEQNYVSDLGQVIRG